LSESEIREHLCTEKHPDPGTIDFSEGERRCGRYVQEQLYLFLCWATPVLAVTTAVSVILVALV